MENTPEKMVIVDMLEAYILGGKCGRCGESDLRCLTIFMTVDDDGTVKAAFLCKNSMMCHAREIARRNATVK